MCFSTASRSTVHTCYFWLFGRNKQFRKTAESDMDESTLIRILKSKKEEDSFDFKRKLKLYQTDGKVSDYQRDELIKDILGLANGNGQIVRQTKYLIIGADDKQFDEQGMRVLRSEEHTSELQ